MVFAGVMFCVVLPTKRVRLSERVVRVVQPVARREPMAVVLMVDHTWLVVGGRIGRGVW